MSQIYIKNLKKKTKSAGITKYHLSLFMPSKAAINVMIKRIKLGVKIEITKKSNKTKIFEILIPDLENYTKYKNNEHIEIAK